MRYAFLVSSLTHVTQRNSMASIRCHLLLIFVLTCASPTVFAAVRRHQRRHPPATPLPSPSAYVSPPPSNSPLIHQACRATRFPDLCESALSHLPADAPALDATSAALSAVSQGLQTARSNAQAILEASASNVNRSNAARNCLEFLSYSDRRLAAAAGALRSGVLADARLFAGAAELYQYDCWSALKYVNGTQQVADAMSFLATLANLTGDATAMVAALQRYGDDTSRWAMPQTERDGYWPDSGLDRSGASSQQVRFQAAGSAPDATVCSGGCQFGSVQAAVDAAPANSSRRFLIYIKAGVYEELVRVPFEKTNLVFLGDGMGNTVITGALSADMPGVSTYNTATVGVSGDGFIACNLTFANTAGPDAHQAVAFRSDSDRSILESVEFLGHQDTLYAHSLRQLYKSCRISGTVDFIFGNSAAVFLDCLIFVVPRQLNPERGESNTVTAHGRTDPAQPTGFVFDRCTVNGSGDYLALYRSNPAVHRVYLGRPWKEYSRTVFLNCYLAEIVRPEGWLPWSGDFALLTLYYGEFESSGPGANATARVPWSSQIPEQHLGVYSLGKFIQGDRWIPSGLQGGRVIS